jgi:type II secretory pathway pseudopilin PulG
MASGASRSASRARRANAGFTLVELMVAMSGGLFLTIVLYALSRDTSYVYQRESRVANATLAAVSGFERLAADVARAGHMSTPNINQDPRVCNRPTSTWPDGIEQLRAVAFTTDGASATGTELADLGVKPHTLTLSGAFDASEELYTNSIEPTATGYAVSLNRETPSALRLGISSLPAAAAANLAVMQSVFMSGTVGRIVRLRKDGSEQYGVVTGVATTSDSATINLASNPPLQFRLKGDVGCGIVGTGTSYSLSVINVVRYSIKSMKAVTAYSALFDAAKAGLSADKQAELETRRAELSRVEIAPDGSEIEETEELVAEYAVDLRFVPWAAKSTTNPAIGADVSGSTASADQFTPTAGQPQLLRGVNVRLSVRSREADRATDVGSSGVGSYRFGPLGDAKLYARVRTFQSDIPLRNTEGTNW